MLIPVNQTAVSLAQSQGVGDGAPPAPLAFDTTIIALYSFFFASSFDPSNRLRIDSTFVNATGFPSCITGFESEGLRQSQNAVAHFDPVLGFQRGAQGLRSD